MKDLLMGLVLGFLLATCMWAAFVSQAEKEMVKVKFTIVEGRLYSVSEVHLTKGE